MIALTQIRHDTPYIDTQNLTKAVEECHSPFEQIRLAQTLQTMYDSDDNNGSCSPLGFKCSQIIEEKLKAETFNNGTLNDPRQREPNPQFEKKYLPHITQPVNATLEAAMLTLARTQETPAFYPKQAGYTLYRLSLEHTTKEIANGILNTWLGTTEVNLATLTINGLSHLQFLLGDQQLTPLQQYCALSLIIEPTDRFDLKESLQNMGQALGIKTNASHNEALFLAILSMEKRGLNKDDLLELINEADYPQRALAVQKAWRDQASDLSNSPARKKSKIQQADSLLASLCSHATFEFLPTLRGDQTRIETLISKEHTPYDQLIQVAKWLPSDQHWDSGYEDYLINRFGFEDRTTIRAQLGGLISTRDFYTLCLALANHHPHWQEKIAALFEAPMGSPAYLKVLLAIYKDLDASNMEGLQGILLYQLKTYYQLAVTTTAEAKDIHAQPLTKREDIVCLNIYLKAKLLPCYQGDAVQTLYEQLVKTWGQHASELSEHQATWQRFQANRYQRTSHAHLLDSCALHFASLNRFRSSPLKAQLFLNLFLNYLKQQFGLKKLSSDVLTSINAVFTTIGQTDVASNVLTLLQAGIPVSDAGNAIHLKSPEQLDLSEVRRLNPDYCQALASHYVRFGEKRSRCLALYSTVLKSGNVTKEIAAEYSKQLGLRETCDDTLNSRQMAQLAILYDDYFTAMQNEGTPEEFKALRVTYCRIIANKETLANGQNLYGNGLNDSRHSVSFSDLPNGKL